ncbi:type II toxin-antitoxin system HicA family toxin [Neomoorella carbonis]|uniref:type II toxin-antitoxin system HicA family toxin n=1 Tax=Neomoorella carbonis TaxID=3062783 RepID=UPI0032430FBE
MSQIEKLLKAIKRNPRDVPWEDIDKVLKYYGFNCRHQGGSHYNYYHPELVEILTIPRRRPVKAIYVKQALELIEKLKEGKSDG